MDELPPEVKVPFPGFVPSNDGSSNFVLSNRGMVYRVDAVAHGEAELVLRDPIPRGDGLVVRLAGGTSTRSVALAVQQAFGNTEQPVHDPTSKDIRRKGKQWRLWINPNAPTVKYATVTAPRCSVLDVEWIYGPTHQKWVMADTFEVPASHLLPIWVATT